MSKWNATNIIVARMQQTARETMKRSTVSVQALNVQDLASMIAVWKNMRKSRKRKRKSYEQNAATNKLHNVQQCKVLSEQGKREMQAMQEIRCLQGI